jgi:DNA-binding response OmpR family regulator
MSTPPIVIIAEPDPMISSVPRVEFTYWGFAVFLASDGREAEDYASQTVAHLVVLDTKLHLGTYDACARIRRRQGYAVRPIVLITNEPSSRVKAVAAKAGATMVLLKPYSVSNLFSAIESFVPRDDLLLTHRSTGGWVECPPTMGAGATADMAIGGELSPDPEWTASAHRSRQRREGAAY